MKIFKTLGGIALAAAMACNIWFLTAAPAAAQYVPPGGAIQDYQQKGNGYLGTQGDPMAVGPAYYGAGVTAETAASGVVSAATATATLATGATVTTNITGFSITGGGATSGSLVTCTVAGVITGTLSYVIAVPTGATLGIPVLARTFNPPIPASAVNTAIVVSCPTFGSGNTAASINAEGFTR